MGGTIFSVNWEGRCSNTESRVIFSFQCDILDKVKWLVSIRCNWGHYSPLFYSMFFILFYDFVCSSDIFWYKMLDILPWCEFFNFIILNMTRLPSPSSVNYNFNLKVSAINYLRNIIGGFLFPKMFRKNLMFYLLILIKLKIKIHILIWIQ